MDSRRSVIVCFQEHSDDLSRLELLDDDGIEVVEDRYDRS